MKRIFAILLASLLAAALISCGEEKKTDDKPGKDEGEIVENNGTAGDNESVVYEDVDLVLVADSLYEGIAEDNRPFVATMPLTSEDFEYFTFIPYEEGLEAVVNEPMMGSIAHSIVLVKCPTAEKAEEVAGAMKDSCDPRKWICVEADIVEAVTNKNIAMLLMTTTEGGMSETILKNFKALDEEKIASLAVVEESEDEALGDESEEVLGDESEPILDENGEVVTEEENVVIEVPETEVENTPAEGTEEENVPAVMPEVTPEEVPEVEVETPAVEPEVETPAVEPEVETPEAEQVPVETPELEIEAPAQEPEEVPAEEETPAEEPEEAAPAGNIDELYALADKLYAGIDPENMPMVGTMELGSENFEYSAFVPYKDSYLAVESLPMMGSQPHSVVIVKTESAEEAASLAAQMEASANPRKWICVSARSVKSASKGNFAILVMTSVEVMPVDGIDEAAAEEMSASQSEERAQLIINNFLANA